MILWVCVLKFSASCPLTHCLALFFCSDGGRIKHYFIHRRSGADLNATGGEPKPTKYFLFENGFEAPSIVELLNHYTEHNLQGLDIKLTKPVIDRSLQRVEINERQQSWYTSCATWGRTDGRSLIISCPTTKQKQCCHHNGDQAARRPRKLCSICVHSFGALPKAVGLFTSRPHFIDLKCILKRALLTLSSISNHFAAIWKGNFSTSPSLGLGETWKAWNSPFDSSLIVSYLLPIDTYGLALTVLELFSWHQERLRLSIRLSDPVAMTNTTSEAIASSSGKNEILFSFRFYTVNCFIIQPIAIDCIINATAKYSLFIITLQPQWWSDRSTIKHILLDLWSPIGRNL